MESDGITGAALDGRAYGAVGVPGKRVRRLLPDLRDYLHNAWVEIALNVLGLASGILIARHLGPDGRGQLGAAMMWPATIGMLISIGLQHAFAYAAGREWATPARLNLIAWRFTLAVGFPATVVYWFMCPWIFRNVFGDQIYVPRIFALGIPLSLYTGLLLPVYQGVGTFSRWNIGRLFRSGGWTLSVLLLIAAAGLTVLNLLVAQVLILLLLGIYLFSQLGKIHRSPSGLSAQASTGRIFKYGIAIYLSGLAYTVNQQLDQLWLSMWVPPGALGQYAAAATLASMMLLIPSSIGPIVFSKVARSGDASDEQRSHMLFAVTLTTVLSAPAGIILTLAAPRLTEVVYGSAYAQAGELLRVLAPAVIFLGIGITLADLLRGVGRPMYATYGALAGAMLTVGGLAWALPRYGVWGAAWVSFAAYALMMVVQVMLLWLWTYKAALARRGMLISL